MDRPNLSADQIAVRRDARSQQCKDRKRRGRGRALFSKAYDVQDWAGLSAGDQEMWIRAVDEAQSFEHDESPLVIAAMLGSMLNFYDMSKARSHVVPESEFLQLPTEEQELLFRLATSLNEPLVVEARPSVVATIELSSPMDMVQSREFFDALADHLGELEENNPGKNWDMALSMTNFSFVRHRWLSRFRRGSRPFSHKPKVL